MEAKTAIPLVCILWAASLAWAQQSPAEKLIETGHWKRARTIVEARIREAPDDPLACPLLSQIRNAFGDLGSVAIQCDGPGHLAGRAPAPCRSLFGTWDLLEFYLLAPLADASRAVPDDLTPYYRAADATRLLDRLRAKGAFLGP